jgi:hypothetical protein
VTVDRQSVLVKLDGEGKLWRAISSGPLAPKQAVDALVIRGVAR